MTTCRCATASRFTAGPTIFLTEAHEEPWHPASARPGASSDGRSRPRLLEPLGLGDAHTAELGLPVVERRFGDAMLAGKVGRLRPRLVLLQNPNNLFFREPCSLHLSVLRQAEL